VELPDALYQQVTYLSERGNTLMDDGEPAKAAELFEKAFALLPEPKTEWEAATWLNASIGDALFAQEHYREALQYFLDALNCPDGISNPFVQLRLGECFYELGDRERASEYLLRAYMLAGREIFEDEPQKYFLAIKPII
jgi:tetratricopeptide (TPR) repeat protein